MAVYDMENCTARTVEELTAYINRMNERLRFVLTNLDDENITEQFEQDLRKK